METPQIPVLDETTLTALGDRIFKTFRTFVTDRRQVEERWLANLRQVRGIYDPKVLAMIPADRSKAYPKMTAWMVRGTIARLMQMLFPQTEKNYGIKASPMPDLSIEQLQQVLDGLVAAKGGDPAAVMLEDEEIEKGIAEFAKGKAERMELKIDDDLQEMEYVTLARKVVRSAAIYNVGVLKGPLATKVKARTWQKNANTGKYEAIEVDKFKPLYEFLPVLNYYPDLTAVSLDKQDGAFERHIMIRSQVEDLANRPDFLTDRVLNYLRDNTSGNYKAQWWESEMKSEPKAAQESVAQKESRKYEVLSFWGGVTGHELRAAGVTIPDEDLGRMFNANVWQIDNLTIKCRLAPLGETVRHHHEFVFEDDDLSILGNGQCDVLRDSQLSLCEVTRAALDNAGVIGPMAEIDMDRLVPGQNTSIAKHKTYFTEDNGPAANTPAVRNVNIDSHIADLLNLAQLFLGFADKESGLPPASLGDTSGGGSEALRTSRNASMFLGAAALPVRDTVRNFDSFTMSVIGGLVAWNKRFDPNKAREGDYNVIARGSTSLIAKEVLAQQLEEFRAGLVDPEEAAHIKKRGLLIARMKANDLPLDDLLEDEDTANQNIARMAETQAKQAQVSEDLIRAQIEEALASAVEKMAKADATGTNVGVEVLRTLIDAFAKQNKAATDMAKAKKPVGGGNG